MINRKIFKNGLASFLKKHRNIYQEIVLDDLIKKEFEGLSAVFILPKIVQNFLIKNRKNIENIQIRPCLKNRKSDVIDNSFKSFVIPSYTNTPPSPPEKTLIEKNIEVFDNKTNEIINNLKGILKNIDENILEVKNNNEDLSNEMIEITVKYLESVKEKYQKYLDDEELIQNNKKEVIENCMKNQEKHLNRITLYEKDLAISILGNSLVVNDFFLGECSFPEAKIKHEFMKDG